MKTIRDHHRGRRAAARRRAARWSSRRGGHITPLAPTRCATGAITVVRAPTGARSWPARRRPTSGASRSAATTPAWRCGGRSSRTCARQGLRGRRDRHRRAASRSTILTSRRSWRWPVARGEADGGIVIDGAGLGSAIAANKIAGVRAAMCTTPTLARYAREHNGANVLTLGATLLIDRRGARDRRHLAGHADDRAALHPPAGEDPTGSRPEAAPMTPGIADHRAPRRADHRRGDGGARPQRRRRGAVRLPRRALRLLPDPRPRPARRRARRASACTPAAAGPARSPALIDHTLLKPDATASRDRGAVPRGGGVPVRDRLRQPDLGRDGARACCAARRVGVCSVVGFPLGRDDRRT